MFKPSRLFIIALFILTFTVATKVHAGNIIIGKVVGVSDGDTITVLENRTQHKIRLYGIDCPERRQDFGTRARQFVSTLVFGKQVRVVKYDTDRYGRIVGMVYVGDLCVNEVLVKNGLAWVYRRYCKIPVCSEWLDLEAQAMHRKIGLWSHSHPLPPWEFRRSKRKASE